MANSPERKKRNCIVPVCNGERFDLVHKFPMDNERAKLWNNLINNPILTKLPIDFIRKRYFVCSRHFRVQDYKNIKSRGLNKTAIPTLNMNEFTDPENFNRFESMIYHIDMNDKVEEIQYKKIDVEENLTLPTLVPLIKKRKIEIQQDLTLIEVPSAVTEIPVINLVEVIEEENQLIEEHLKNLNNSEVDIILPVQSPLENSNNHEGKLR